MQLSQAAKRDSDQSGWEAQLSLRYRRRWQRSVLAERQQRGPLLVQRPFYPEGDEVAHTYLIHPPGGIVGGDRLRLDVTVERDASVLLTTPSATRWYYSDARSAQCHQQADVAAGATLEWLPQESLFFDGAHAHLSTRIDLHGNGRFFGWEILGFGRPACAERYTSGVLDFRFEVYRDGVPLLIERLRTRNGTPRGLQGHAASATVIASGTNPQMLSIARELCAQADDCLAAATCVGELLICRGLAQHCAPLLALCQQLWGALRPVQLARPSCPPRIWLT